MNVRRQVAESPCVLCPELFELLFELLVARQQVGANGAEAEPERARQYLAALDAVIKAYEERGFRRAVGLKERETSADQLEALKEMGYLDGRDPEESSEE